MNGLSFLCERAMPVKVNDSYFKVHVLKSAVVQGSVLGPMLFNIYIRLFYMFMEHWSIKVLRLKASPNTVCANYASFAPI